MARLIWKVDYIDNRKSKKSKSVASLSYIGQRSGVELNNEKKQTVEQENTLEQLLKKFNESELNAIKRKQIYAKYNSQPSQKTITDLIHFLDDVSNAKERYNNDSVGYLRYIGRRKGVELNEKSNPTFEEHGLFNSKGAVDFEVYKNELENHEGLIFRHIISLKKEDAEQCGLKSQKAWKTLLNEKFMQDLAKEMKINYTDFRWVAAYHNKEDNPHVHLMIWDKHGGGCFYKENIENMKSKIVNTIYKEERKNIYAEQLKARNEFRDKILIEMKYIVGHSKYVTTDDDKKILSELETLSKMIPSDSKLKYQHLKNNKHHMNKLQQLNKCMDLILKNEKYSEIIGSYIQSKIDLAKFYKDGNYSEEEKKAISELKERMANILLDSAKQLNIKSNLNPHLIAHLKFIENDLKNARLNVQGIKFENDSKKNIYIEKTLYDVMKVYKILNKSDEIIKTEIKHLLIRSDLTVDDKTVNKLLERLKREVSNASEYKNTLNINKHQFNKLATNLDLTEFTNNYEPKPLTVTDVVNRIGWELNSMVKQNEYLQNKEQQEIARLRRKMNKKGKRKGREIYGSKYQNQQI